MIDDVETTDAPHDRLTRLCDAMIATLEEHPESGDEDKCCIFLMDAEKGGIVLHGYDDQIEAAVDLIIHLQAVFRSAGKELQIVGIPNSPEGLDVSREWP